MLIHRQQCKSSQSENNSRKYHEFSIRRYHEVKLGVTRRPDLLEVQSHIVCSHSCILLFLSTARQSYGSRTADR